MLYLLIFIILFVLFATNNVAAVVISSALVFLPIFLIIEINFGDKNHLDNEKIKKHSSEILTSKDKKKVKKSEEGNKKSSKHGFALPEKQVQKVTEKMKKDLEDDLFG
jgi:hypothetical protein